MRIEIINPQLLARLLMVFGLLVFTNAPAGTKDFALHEAVLDDDKQLVTRLLNKGAAINVIGSRKYGYGSALHLAVREGHLEIAKLLLKRGAEVDVLDPDDYTPLHNAAWNGNLEMTELLLDAGADINASTYDGDTPLSLAQNNDQPQVAVFIQTKLQPSATSETKVKPPSATDPDAINISGTYISEITYPTHGEYYAVRFVKKKNRKEITLEQTGNAINSVDSPGDPEIIGTREGNTINFFYIVLGNEITGTWEINADGTEMVGKWNTDGAGGASGKWNF